MVGNLLLENLHRALALRAGCKHFAGCISHIMLGHTVWLRSLAHASIPNEKPASYTYCELLSGRFFNPRVADFGQYRAGVRLAHPIRPRRVTPGARSRCY